MSEPTTEMLPNTGELDSIDDEVLSSFLQHVDTCHYNADFIGQAESIASGQLDQIRLPVVHWWLRRQKTVAALLARLFAYGDFISSVDFEEAIPKKVSEAFLRVGLLHRDGDRISSRMRLMPFESLWIASDEMNASGDPVMGPGATTLQLARAMSIKGETSMLDVGCGAGTLALVAAARGAELVVGVDLMERAIHWSRFNARLNGLTASFMAGDLIEPVAGKRFDLIVSQPPFVIQPEGAETTTYLHGGRVGDEITLRLLGELPKVLSNEGRAIILFDAPRIAGSPLDDRLNSTMGESGFQLHAVMAQGHSADLQSVAYSSVQHPQLGERYGAAVHAIREHLEKLGIDGSDHVLLHVRPAPAGEDQRTVVLETDSLKKWEGTMLDELVISASLATSSDDELLARSVRVPPGASLVQQSTFEEPVMQHLKLHFTSGRASDFELSDAAAVVVDAARQGAPVSTIVQHFAEVAHADPRDVKQNVLSFVRKALLLGLLKPA